MNKSGFLTLAIGKEYIKCAAMLARSIKLTQLYFNEIVLITDGSDIIDPEDQVFDDVIIVPKESDIWQTRSEIWKYSPFECTMFIEADMLLTSDISLWFNMARNSQLLVTQSVRNYRNEIYTGSYYRRFLIQNNLPNIYSGIMIWNKSEMIDTIFNYWSTLTKNWDNVKNDFRNHNYDTLPADEGLAIAIRNTGMSDVILNSNRLFPTFIHCKQDVLQTNNINWTKNIDFTITESLEFKLGYYRSLWPIHYHIKELATSERMNQLCGNYITMIKK